LAAKVLKVERASREDAEFEADISADQLDDIVQQLNGIYRSTSLEFALRVGAVIIHHFYGGDPGAWRDRGRKVNSFRRLAEHPGLALSAGALYRCVALFEICERLHAPARWRRLGVSHLRAVIGISGREQERLLTQANEERWSVQVLQAKAQNLRVSRARGGRKAQSALCRHARALDRCLQHCNRAFESVRACAVNDVEQSLERLGRIKSAAEDLLRTLQTQQKHPTPADR
jgi:hypothetical protein